jgi:hypothetical protein
MRVAVLIQSRAASGMRRLSAAKLAAQLIETGKGYRKTAIPDC